MGEKLLFISELSWGVTAGTDERDSRKQLGVERRGPVDVGDSVTQVSFPIPAFTAVLSSCQAPSLLTLEDSGGDNWGVRGSSDQQALAEGQGIGAGAQVCCHLCGHCSQAGL